MIRHVLQMCPCLAKNDLTHLNLMNSIFFSKHLLGHSGGLSICVPATHVKHDFRGEFGKRMIHSPDGFSAPLLDLVSHVHEGSANEQMTRSNASSIVAMMANKIPFTQVAIGSSHQHPSGTLRTFYQTNGCIPIFVNVSRPNPTWTQIRTVRWDWATTIHTCLKHLVQGQSSPVYHSNTPDQNYRQELDSMSIIPRANDR